MGMHNQARLPVVFVSLGAKIRRKLRQQNAQNYTGHHHIKIITAKPSNKQIITTNHI